MTTLAVALALASLVPVADDAAAAPEPGWVTHPWGEISFTADLEDARQRAVDNGTPVVLVFAADWCPSCRLFRRTTLVDPAVQAYSEEVIWVAVDIDRHPETARAWGVRATPELFFLEPDGDVVGRVLGVPSAEELADRLRALVDAGPGTAGAAQPANPGSEPWSPPPATYRGRSICYAHVGYGPLSIRSQSVFQALRSGLLPRTPSTLGRGDNQVRGRVTWANLWAVDQGAFWPETGALGPYVVDFETLDASVAWAHGLLDTVELEVELEQRWRFGGAMDSAIQGFHDLFGIAQSGRDRVDRNRHRFWVEGAGGEPAIDLGAGDGGTFTRSAMLTLQHTLTCGTATWPALSWSVSARTSLNGSEGLEGRRLDVGLSVAAARRFGDFHVYLTLGYAWYGSERYYGVELDSTQLTAMAAGEWRFAPRMSLILQYLRTEGAAVDIPPFSEPSNEIVVGWKWEATTGGVLEVGLLENIVTFDNSPDFGIHAAWLQRF
ncbi:MAG TPA: DUF3187 family protein [Candidatus Sulfomarinibacteraceae bacterium]|nr:DUF3187 family protein [Candidatus Sulfomarinibacteraceae bacterium]